MRKRDSKVTKNDNINIIPMRYSLQKLCLLASLSLIALTSGPAYAQDNTPTTIRSTNKTLPAYSKEKLRRVVGPGQTTLRPRTTLRARPNIAETNAPYDVKTYRAAPYVAKAQPSEIYVSDEISKKTRSSTKDINASPKTVDITVQNHHRSIESTSIAPTYKITPEMLQTQPLQLPEATASSQIQTIPVPEIKVTERETLPPLPLQVLNTESKEQKVVVQPTPSIHAVDPIPLPLEDIKTTPTSGKKVTFFDATASGNSPSFEEAVEPTAIQSSITPSLSRDSEKILEKLPVDLFPTPPAGIKQGFAVSRSDTTRSLPNTVNFDTQNGVGANIAVKRQQIDVNYELEKAYNALLQGNTEIAVMIYNDLLTVAPDNKHALFGLATTYHKLGLLEKARPVYGKLLELDPYNKETLNNFLALIGEEAPDSAIAYLEQLKANNTDFSPIYAQLAQLYKKQGNLRSAILNMQQATAISPENMVYMYNLAVLYDGHKDTRRAEALYRRLIKAGLSGKEIPASISDIQERLTYLSSN